MNLQAQIEQAAINYFAQVMSLSLANGQQDGTELFKVLMTIKVDGETKILLIFGKAYTFFGDGLAYAVLNPSAKVLECVNPLYSYEKCAFIGECDFMSKQWVNTNGEAPRAAGGYRYNARKPLPARTKL